MVKHSRQTGLHFGFFLRHLLESGIPNIFVRSCPFATPYTRTTRQNKLLSCVIEYNSLDMEKKTVCQCIAEKKMATVPEYHRRTRLCCLEISQLNQKVRINRNESLKKNKRYSALSQERSLMFNKKRKKRRRQQTKKFLM